MARSLRVFRAVLVRLSEDDFPKSPDHLPTESELPLGKAVLRDFWQLVARLLPWIRKFKSIQPGAQLAAWRNIGGMICTKPNSCEWDLSLQHTEVGQVCTLKRLQRLSC